MARVVVIGGGVVGLSCAYYLLKDGHTVTVIDRDGCTRGASWGNAGMIVPSHFEPMANPAMLALGLKMFAKRGAPLGFRGFGFGLLGWSYLYFLSAMTPNHVKNVSTLIRDLNIFSKVAYYDLLGDRLNLRGLLMVCKTEHAFGEEKQVTLAARELALKTDTLGRQDLKDLGFDATGAIWFRDDASLTPPDFLSWLLDEVKKLGGSILAAEVQAFRIARPAFEGSTTIKAIHAVETSEGEIEHDIFVLAAGAWSGRLAKKLGIKLPMTPGRGYGFTVPNPPKETLTAAILVESRVATTPMSGGQRFTGVMEIGGWSDQVTPARLDAMRAAIPEYLPAYRGHVFDEEVWVGHRPCSPDGVPYIGRFAGYPNLIAATGHGMMGMSLGPGTGQLVAKIVSGRDPILDLRPCSPDRFG